VPEEREVFQRLSSSTPLAVRAYILSDGYWYLEYAPFG
jgi:hypothetical protein